MRRIIYVSHQTDPSLDRAAIYRALGEQIRRRRVALHMKQSELAEHVDMSRTSVTNVEAGRQSLLVDQLLRFAMALDVHPAALLNVEAERSVVKSIAHRPELSAWLDELDSSA